VIKPQKTDNTSSISDLSSTWIQECAHDHEVF